MREIKYRAWDKQNKQMRYETIPNSCNYLNSAICDAMNKYGLELMQYTGLNDKNGKQIYEGDVFRTCQGIVAVVEWEKEGRFLGFTLGGEKKIMYINREPAVEIIGNIHSNPELLEVQNAE